MSKNLEYLQASTENYFRPDDHPEGVMHEFDKFSNDFASRDELYKDLAQAIVKPLYDLTGDELTVTQIAILELDAGKSEGFPWHFDDYSFCFVDTDSPAHTLWLPLNPIDIDKQHGGMAWVHQDDFDARSRLKQWEHYQLADKELKVSGGAYRKTKSSQYRPEGWSGAFDKEMLESLKKECSMELGDAFLFNRYTWHRSQQMLTNGPLKRRTAIIFRLVSMDAPINRTLFDKTMERNKLEELASSKSFGDSLGAFKDGDLIRDAINAGVSF